MLFEGASGVVRFLSPGVRLDVAAEVSDGIDQELGDITGIVNIAAGLFLAHLEIVGRSEHRRIELISVIRVQFLRISHSVSVCVIEKVGIGESIIDDGFADLFTIDLKLCVEGLFEAVNFVLERLGLVLVAVIVRNGGGTDAAEFEPSGISSGMRLGDILSVAEDAVGRVGMLNVVE